jgi:hypothetical protein
MGRYLQAVLLQHLLANQTSVLHNTGCLLTDGDAARDVCKIQHKQCLLCHVWFCYPASHMRCTPVGCWGCCDGVEQTQDGGLEGETHSAAVWHHTSRRWGCCCGTAHSRTGLGCQGGPVVLTLLTILRGRDWRLPHNAWQTMIVSNMAASGTAALHPVGVGCAC